MLLYDRLFLADSYRQAFRERGWVYAGLVATLALIPLNLYMANFHRSALVTTDVVSPWDYLKVQSEVLVMYLRLSVWPHPLIIDYAGWPTHPTLASVLPYGLAIVALLALTAFGLLRLAPAAYAGAWFFLILAPTSSFLPLPTEIATERRMYLPLMGIVALLVLGGYRLLARRGRAVAWRRAHGTATRPGGGRAGRGGGGVADVGAQRGVQGSRRALAGRRRPPAEQQPGVRQPRLRVPRPRGPRVGQALLRRGRAASTRATTRR